MPRHPPQALLERQLVRDAARIRMCRNSAPVLHIFGVNYLFYSGSEASHSILPINACDFAALVFIIV